MVLNLEPLDWESSVLRTRSFFHISKEPILKTNIFHIFQNVLECLLWYQFISKNHQQSCLVFPNEILESWFLSNKLFSMSSDFWMFRKNLLEGDCVVSRTNKNLFHHYPLYLQNWIALKYILKEVLGYLSMFFQCFKHPNPAFHKHKPDYLHPSRWAFQAPLFRSVPRLWLLMLLVYCFKPLSSHQFKASNTFPLILLPQEESRNSVLIYILREIFWCYMFCR